MIFIDAAYYVYSHFVELAILAAVYAAPSFFLMKTGVHDGTHRQLLIVLNIVLGWTIVMWFYTLYKSFHKKKEKLK